MIGVIYARYSSDNQKEESIDGQLRECKAYAEKNGIQIVDTYIDRALSAKTDNRPRFQQMIKDSASKHFEIILVWKLDRFARNRYDSAHYKNMLRKNGVKVVSITETISQGAEGILLESLLEGMAEYYSVELAEKVTRGMMENALKCKYNGGTLPIGYKVDKEQNYLIDEITAPAVVLAFKSYAEGMSMQHIANMLNYQGVRTHKKTKLDVDIVTRMLHNRKYIGEYKFKDVITPGGIPAIVDKELFELVQEKMKQNKKAPAKHKAEDEYLLTTKLYCGKCQCLMVGESGTSRTKFVHRYYKCVSVKNHKGCDKKTVKKAWIEDIVVDSIRRLIMNDETIEYLTDQALETFNKESTVLPILQKQYAQTLTAINNLITAMEKGIITPTTKERMEELEAEKSELSIRIMKEEMSRPKLTREEILYWFYKFRKLNPKKLDHRRTLINNFVNSVFLFEDRMVITFNFKDGTETITFADLEKSALSSDFKVSGAPTFFRCLMHRKIFYAIRDLNPKRVRSVKKTVRWTVFSSEVLGGYCCTATVAEDAGFAKQSRVPSSASYWVFIRDSLVNTHFFAFKNLHDETQV